MKPSTLILCLALALGGCSILRKDEPAVCDGKHRRPANPSGSVLEHGAPTADRLSAMPQFFASCA